MLNKIIFSVAAKRVHLGFEAIKPLVKDFLSEVTKRIFAIAEQTIIMQNGLADGGDMLIADSLLSLPAWPDPRMALHGIFPFPKDNYLKTIENKEHFNLLLNNCDQQLFLRGIYLEGTEQIAIEARAAAYRAQAARLLYECDFLLALADENDPLKAGGATETIGIALADKIPVVFISLRKLEIMFIRDEKDWAQLAEKNGPSQHAGVSNTCDALFRELSVV